MGDERRYKDGHPEPAVLRPPGVRSAVTLDGAAQSLRLNDVADRKKESKSGKKKPKVTLPSFPTTPTSEAGLLSPMSPLSPRFGSGPSKMWFYRRGLTLLLLLGGFCFVLYAFSSGGQQSESAMRQDAMAETAGGQAPLAHVTPTVPLPVEPSDPLQRVRWWHQDKPKKRFAIVMVAAGETYDGLYNASVYSHAMYADIHNYHLFVDHEALVEVDNPEKDNGRFRMYQKLVTLYKYILKGLEEKTYDWILWNDSDIFVTNPAVHLESFIPYSDDGRRLPNVIAAWDWNGLNAGSMLLRVDYWTLAFFARALAYRYYGSRSVYNFQDQESIVNLIAEHQDVKERFFRTPVPHWFNAYPDGNDDIRWRKEDFLIHLPGPYKDRWRDQLKISETEVQALIGKWTSVADEASWSEYDLALQGAVQRWWDTKPAGVP